MNHSIKVGFSFGMTSAIITTLGLMIGLNSGTHSKMVVLGGILTIAIADAFSDALGIHISEESENKHTGKEIWISTVSTFLAKFFFSLTFIIPILFFELDQAVSISVIWGLLILSILSFKIAQGQKKKPWGVIIEHILIALTVVFLTNSLGNWLAKTF